MTSLLQFHYADTEVIQAAAKTIPITVTDSGGLILGTDYTLSITGRPTNASSSALAINSSTGEITITSNAPTDDEGVYTVTAEGQGNYAGNKHTSFTLTVLSPTTTQPRTLQHVIALGTIPSTNALSNDYDTFTQEVLRNYPPGAAVVGKYITETEKGAGNASSWANAADVGWLEDIVTNTPDTAKMVYLVLVGAGTHKPAATLAMRNNAAIIGGWEAAGSWSRRGGQTTFDGDNARQVFFNFNIDNTSLLYDVTISNGQSMYGSGMSNNNASPVLSNVTFSDNAASIDGGGMSSQGLSSPILTDVTFLRNTAGRHGGGMDHDNSSSLTLTRVKFLKNTADKHGGGCIQKLLLPSLM